MSVAVVELVRVSDGTLVEASLLDGMAPGDLLLVEREWGPYRSRLLGEFLKRSVPRTDWPQSLHWDWSRKASELRLLAASGFGIRCNDVWQGAMLTKTASYETRLPEDARKPLVYIDYLETAPWNWPLPVIRQDGLFRGVGSVLLREAVKQSFDEGFHGRVGLHALPQAEGFYTTRCGMTPFGRDPKKQNLLYFEFSRGQADAFLKKGGAA